MASQIQCPTFQNLWKAVLTDSHRPQDLSLLHVSKPLEAKGFECHAEAGEADDEVLAGDGHED